MEVDFLVAKSNLQRRHNIIPVEVKSANAYLYRAFVLEERPIDEVARAYGVTKNRVSQTKVRLGRMIEAIEAEFGDSHIPLFR